MAPIYFYVLILSDITNHHANYYFINDWKMKYINEEMISNPVYSTITFFLGFLDQVMDLDPNLKSSDGVFISKIEIVSQFKYQDFENFKFLPKVLMFLR
jgi:hypothetical protein